MSDALADHVVVEVRGNAAIVRLNRPERLNAFTVEMVAAIRRAAKQAVADPAVAGIVITGTGRAFSSGLDSGDLVRSTEGTLPSDGPRDPGEVPALFGFLLSVPKPVIAAVNGVAAGGGLVLAMLCDLRFAVTSASFTTVFAKRGLVAEHGTSWLLPRLVGTSRALDLLWSARRIGADEAYRIGLADRVVPGEAVVDEACAYIDDLAENVALRSVAMMKDEVYRGLSQTLHDALRDVNADIDVSLAHADAREGVASFLERRPPRFSRVGEHPR